MQLVEIRERIEERATNVWASAVKPEALQPSKPKLFDNLRKFELVAFGVPEEWVDEVRSATEETLFEVITHLPQEAQEALLKLAVGEKLAAETGSSGGRSVCASRRAAPLPHANEC